MASPKVIKTICMETFVHVNLDWDLASDRNNRLGKINTTIAPHKAPVYRIILPVDKEQNKLLLQLG